MRLIPLIIIALLTITTACNSDKKAGSLFSQAEKLYGQKEFNKAKLLIDSILTTYPKSIEFGVRGKKLLSSITKAEQQNNLQFLDSLLKVKEAELEPLLRNFEENNEAGGIPRLIHKRQKTENSFGRTFIMANLNKNGDFFLSSRYMGSKRLHHTKIRVYHDKLSAESENIEEDGMANRTFYDDGLHWEIVSYKNNKDNGIADLISQHYQLPLKAEFIGTGRQYIVLEQHDKEAIRDAYEISFLLREVEKIKEQRSNVEKTIKAIGK